MYRGIKVRFSLYSGLLLVLALFFGPSAMAQTPSEGVFQEAASPDEVSEILNEEVLRSRRVTIDASQLLQRDSTDLFFNLFDDVEGSAKFNRGYKNNSGSQTWIGVISNTPGSNIVLIIKGNEVFGTIDIPKVGRFSIKPISDTTHLIEQINLSSDHIKGTDAMIPDRALKARLQPEQQGSEIAISSDDGSIIDVYVAFDQDAPGGSVDASKAQSLAELFVAYTNQAYINSNINQRLWLVGTVDGYDYRDVNTGSLTSDLNAVTIGSIEGLHDKRDEHHADLVMFFTPETNVNYCAGLAWLQTTTNDTSFNAYGFSVMSACSYGQSIFAHELGHNMGSRHDWYLDSGVTPASIGHGYVDTANGFITIMSYTSRCDVLGKSCDRIPYFSNPSVSYNGFPTGIASGTSINCSEQDPVPAVNCDADNSTNFNSKALVTSKFRDSRVTWTGANGVNWSDPGNWSIKQGAPGSTVTVNRVPRSYDNVLIPSGLSTYPLISAPATARELTIENGATLEMTQGTLTVGWSWEDDGGFSAKGGLVELSGPIGITLTTGSVFNDLKIGTGSDTTHVKLESNLDISGDLTVSNGATLSKGSYEINREGGAREPSVATLVPYYRLYNSSTSSHFYTQDSAEYTYLESVGWTQEGAGFYIYDSVTTLDNVTTKPWYRLYNLNSKVHFWTLSATEYASLGNLGWRQEGIAGYLFDSQVRGSTSLYRLYNESTGKHHWTKDSNEYGILVGLGWKSEGVAGYVFETLDGVPASLIPYYRLYNSDKQSHFYTQDDAEYSYLGDVGWNQEGVGYYIYDSSITIDNVTAKPWYRLYNLQSNVHFWTLSAAENSNLGDQGWRQEGIAGYLFDSQVPNSTSLYRLYNESVGKHHWTKDRNEHDALLSQGWTSEGVAGYVFTSM